MTLYSGTEGTCAWTLIVGALDDQTVERFTTNLKALVTAPAPGQIVLDMLFDVPMPTAVQRRRIVDVLQSAPDLDKATAHALVINNSIGRGLLTAINWVVQPAFDEKIFSKPDDALTWLTERSTSFDGSRILESIRREVPDFHQLMW